MMCGICGTFGLADKDLLKKMCGVLIHRGPDDSGLFLDGAVALGHRRLSIIDLNTGCQPIFNEDGSIAIVYNGEIYNFKELRDRLLKLGHRFYTGTDTEVIVHSYEEWGHDSVKKFNGMFAFAIWDKNKKELFLARDRNGIKPLYYTVLNGIFLFASEIKSILQYDEVKREVDLQAFHYYANLRYVPGEKTMFRGISRLLPGHMMIVGSNGIRKRKYWDFRVQSGNYSEDYLIKKLRKILKRSVERHMISDVPIGIYLSGGVDSSAVVAMASQLTEEPVRTFCMGFGELEDELEDARFVADRFGTDHRELVVDQDLLRDYPTMVWHADAPKRNFYTYYVARFASEHVKVVLGGIGGDELFAGYEWKYQFVKDVEGYRKTIAQVDKKKLIKNTEEIIRFQIKYGNVDQDKHLQYLRTLTRLDSNVDLYLLFTSLDEVFHEEYLPKIYSDKLLKETRPVSEVFKPYFPEGLSFIDQVFLADYRVKMIDDFLFVEDAMSMSQSLESRVPFLDNELVDFAFDIPPSLKIRDGKGKYILRKALQPILPMEVINKEKHGFGGSVFLQFKNEIADYAHQRLPDGNLVREKLIKRDYINEILNHKISPDLSKHYALLWNLLVFEVWYDIYIKPEKIKKPKFTMDKII